MPQIKVGKYLTLDDFCKCTLTYQNYADKIDPFPKNREPTIDAIKDLNQFIIDPIIDYFGLEKFKLTYGFCSSDLKSYLQKKDPITGQKNGRVAPELDQHMAHEVNIKGNYYCQRLGAASDFLIKDLATEELVQWILQAKLPFDSLYFYATDRPIHISYGPRQKRDIWAFTPQRQPTKKGIEHWVELAKQI
ncbi:hypothetical protein C7B64_00045 [Merismopedia glauca CCAP 1448/3]|uniref:Peptidase M15A C-terminal domain-containing protein n=1 Tax=Merismopedia glauca CCAP 1448/3 TaxID=1296344 RepID=A0A2T1CAK4_9CYAN|nr:hypothetical protein C7B64_00045 [Merismopedia glauca CCAP 1448/3]